MMQFAEPKKVKFFLNAAVMSPRNYYLYCCAWCAVTEPEIDSYWAYDEYQQAGNGGIVFL